MRYKMVVPVVSVAERLASKWMRGTGKDTEFEENSTGWFATLDFGGVQVSVRLGSTEPDVSVGDRVMVTLERVRLS